MARRRSRSLTPGPRAGSVLMGGGNVGGGGGRQRPQGRGFGRGLALLALLALVVVAVAGVLIWRHGRDDGGAQRRAAATAFVRAWTHGDEASMYRQLTPTARAAVSQRAFLASYRSADRAAGSRAVRAGRIGLERDGTIAVPMAVQTEDLGTLRGTVRLPVQGSGDDAGVAWTPALRLPGLRAGEAVRRRSGSPPPAGEILAADGTLLNATGLGASVAGQAGEKPTGLQRIYADRLNGHPSASLVFGRRVIARVGSVGGRSVHTTLRPALMQTANSALGANVGGVAVIRPHDGAVLALAGLAVSAPQPPGSTFKIVTLSAALQDGTASPSSSYPMRTAATLSGVKLSNASGESCGGSLGQAFADSCNSVFAPLGAKLGAKKLVAAAEAFGFNEALPDIPALATSTISQPDDLRDDLAVGSAAIGQDRDLATPLQMASIGATIALGGRRARPRLTALEKVSRKRVVSTRVAHEVRTMMIGVVRSGTGTAGALPGVEVAGKTGTAELKANSKDPKDTDAWFVAFAPATHPTVALAVMLVGAGFGGDTAAPVARKVLAAALS
jgi:penicillin-binding protein A